MTTALLTERDIKVRDTVLRQLEWEPEVDASEIGVTAHGGVVTLTGYVDSYSAKLAAERIAKRVRGVRGVANDIGVRLKLARTDSEIAADAVRALEMRGTVPSTVQAAVHDGHITLTGNVGWLFQKFDAERAVKHIKGVRGVFNHIVVTGTAIARDVRHRIIESLHRHADFDARRVGVEVNSSMVTLRGVVSTWLERDAAEKAAAAAPGVTYVDNQIVVEPGVEPVDEMC